MFYTTYLSSWHQDTIFTLYFVSSHETKWPWPAILCGVETPAGPIWRGASPFSRTIFWFPHTLINSFKWNWSRKMKSFHFKIPALTTGHVLLSSVAYFGFKNTPPTILVALHQGMETEKNTWCSWLGRVGAVGDPGKVTVLWGAERERERQLNYQQQYVAKCCQSQSHHLPL